MNAFQSLAGELAVTAADRDVWLAIGLALVLGAGCLVFGVWATRTVGLLGAGAPAGETVAVGLSAGLMVVASWWAAIWSGGRSSFVPVAVGFAIALIASVWQRLRRQVNAAPGERDLAAELATGSTSPSSVALAALAGGAFVVLIALLYGSTMIHSPQDGHQLIEKTDVAFYAVLGNDLATSGTEVNSSPSGFSDLPGDSPQTWYHWGELWLASAVIKVFGATPLSARYLVVLPLVLLAAAALTGTVVRRLNVTSSRPAYFFGFFACLLLAPIPIVEGPFFSVWASGLIYGIAVFGLAAVAVVLGLYLVAALDTARPSWPLATFAGSALAFILPAHLVVAVLALLGVGAVWTIRIASSLVRTRRLPAMSSIWRSTVIVSTIGLVSTVAWGWLTGHGLGSGAQLTTISPFNDSWRDSVAIVTLGAGMLLAIPIAWLVARRDNALISWLCFGTVALLVAGAFAWGWRLPSFNMFYFFFAGIAVVATPVAAVAVWYLAARLRASKYRAWAVAVVVLCFLQLELGLVLGLTRLQGHSEVAEPIPVSLLAAIRGLPAGAKLAYSCQSLEEISFVNSKLLGIDAHTDRRIVPMCFEADVNGPLLGAPVSADRADAGFAAAPQASLYPDATARPSGEATAAFLKMHGIEYIYADAAHPNALVPEATVVASSDGFELLRLP